MKRVFIGYRREDTSDFVHWIGPILGRLLAHDKVFFDIQIRPGVPFVAELDRQLRQSNVALIVIGPEWLGVDGKGKRRIDDASDLVRIEVERLLARSVPIIPLLVRGTRMPSADVLPATLGGLGGLQAVVVPENQEEAVVTVVDALLRVLRAWREIEIRGAEGTRWSHSWADTAWLSDTEGWLCGWSGMGGAGGHVGRGVLLHTADGGTTWARATNIYTDTGQFSWGGYRWNWTEVGPITSMLLYPRQRADDEEEIVNGYLATWTGVYRAAAPSKDFTHDVRWLRSTPIPAGKRPFAMFSWITGIEGDNELYASGWLGIANWIRNTEWTLQKEAFTYDMPMVANVGGSDNRNVWAIGRTGDDGFGDWGSASRGALYHLARPENEWKRVDLTGIHLEERQAFTGLWVEDHAHVFVVGDRGLFVRGERQSDRSWLWERSPVPDAVSLRRVLKNELGLWVIGERGTILHSLDNGKHWTRLDLPDVESSLHNIRFFDSKGWIVGEKTVLRLET